MMLGFSYERYKGHLRHPACLILSVFALSGFLMIFHSWGGAAFAQKHPVWIFYATVEGLLWAAVIATYLSCSLKLPAGVSKVLALGGAASFSIYVWHFALTTSLYPWVVPLIKETGHGIAWLLPLQKVLLDHPAATSLLVGLLVVFPATLAVSLLTYRYIEMPFFSLRRQYVVKANQPAIDTPCFSFSSAYEHAMGKCLQTGRLAAVAAACIVGVGLAGEVVCRTMNVQDSQYLQPDDRLGFSLLPGKTVKWQMEGYSNDAISSAGFRDVEHRAVKEPGVKRILILGDSMAEGLQVPLVKTAARKLEEKLSVDGHSKVEVINAACSNYSLGQSTIQYTQLAKVYDPDEVLLVYSPRAASVSYRFFPDFSVVSRPYFFINNGLLQLDTSLLPNKRFCALSRFLIKHSRFVSFLAWQDFQCSLTNRFYRDVRTFVVSSARTIVCPKIVYPLPDRGMVRDRVLTYLNMMVRKHGGHLTVCELPSMTEAERAIDHAPLHLLGFQEDFSVLDLHEPICKRGSSTYIKFHFSEIGQDVLAEAIGEFLKARYSHFSDLGLASKPSSDELPM